MSEQADLGVLDDERTAEIGASSEDRFKNVMHGDEAPARHARSQFSFGRLPLVPVVYALALGTFAYADRTLTWFGLIPGTTGSWLVLIVQKRDTWPALRAVVVVTMVFPMSFATLHPASFRVERPSDVFIPGFFASLISFSAVWWASAIRMPLCRRPSPQRTYFP